MRAGFCPAAGSRTASGCFPEEGDGGHDAGGPREKYSPGEMPWISAVYSGTHAAMDLEMHACGGIVKY
jgi:hypothetical protein